MLLTKEIGLNLEGWNKTLAGEDGLVSAAEKFRDIVADIMGLLDDYGGDGNGGGGNEDSDRDDYSGGEKQDPPGYIPPGKIVVPPGKRIGGPVESASMTFNLVLPNGDVLAQAMVPTAAFRDGVNNVIYLESWR